MPDPRLEIARNHLRLIARVLAELNQDRRKVRLGVVGPALEALRLEIDRANERTA